MPYASQLCPLCRKPAHDGRPCTPYAGANMAISLRRPGKDHFVSADNGQWMRYWNDEHSLGAYIGEAWAPSTVTGKWTACA